MTLDAEKDIDFIVMEYVEGETLAERLTRGPLLTWQEAVRYGIELSDALDKAHRAGVVHRDVKPGNIIITKSGIKLLDFGLAKLHSRGSSEPDLSAVTEAKPLTEKGAILGTFQYMSPEQLEGKDSDARSDIFALGVVLYEMVTGEKAFKGDSQASLIAAIMSGAPRALSESGVVSPAALDRIVNVALEKDLDRRWQSAADVGRNLEGLTDSAGDAVAQPTSSARGRYFWAAVGLVVGIVAATIAFLSASTGEHPSPQHFQIAVGPNEGTEPGVRAQVALSRDGTQLAYVVVRDGVSRLYLRRLNEQAARVVDGSEHAFNPFFSPDGEWVAFQTYPGDRRLKKVSTHGGAPQSIHNNGTPAGGTWLPDDTIVFVDWRGHPGLFRGSASGGDAETLMLVKANDGEGIVSFPVSLPDGRSILFTHTTAAAPASVLMSLDTGNRETIFDNATQTRYVSTGHLVFVRNGDLWSVPFDLDRRETLGPEKPVVNGVEQRGWSSFDVSDSGVLAYVPGEEGPWIEETLAWTLRDGQASLATSERHDFEWLRVSPSGDKVALHTADDAMLESEKNVLDSRRQQPTPDAGHV